MSKPVNTRNAAEPSRIKTSFAPVSDQHTVVLILGSMPGDKSLALNEYYGHPQNRFWKMIAAVTAQPLPLTYPAKKQLLLQHGIGVWDVAHTAERKGSLDSAIKDEVPNAIHAFIDAHPNLKVICFNGKTAEKLYDKYFERVSHICYLAMPSTSPANAGITAEALYEKWKTLLIV